MQVTIIKIFNFQRVRMYICFVSHFGVLTTQTQMGYSSAYRETCAALLGLDSSVYFCMYLTAVLAGHEKAAYMHI